MKVIAAIMLLGFVAATDCEGQKAPQGAAKGVFSVGENTKVYFAQGNLQYQASTKTWRFAEHPWDYVGKANKNISASNSGWIDLFGWGTGNNPTLATTEDADYADFVDWGSNAISNGGNKRGLWRTLKKEEWKYVLFNRITESGVRFAKATVNNVEGVLLLPDNWNTSTFSLNDTNEDGKVSFKSNVIDASQWNSLQNVGVVFLPAAGYRDGTSRYCHNINILIGCYWSPDSDSYPYTVYFGDFIFINGANKDRGMSVRLVCPAN